MGAKHANEVTKTGEEIGLMPYIVLAMLGGMAMLVARKKRSGEKA